MKVISRMSLNGFALYVTLLGIVTLILQITGKLDGASAQAAVALAASLG